MHLPYFAIVLIAAVLTTQTNIAATIISTGSGEWNADATDIWSDGIAPRIGNNTSTDPLIGAWDSAEILTGHDITFTGTPGVGGTNYGDHANNDFAIGNGNTLTINGGTFAHVQGSSWVRIGNWTSGTLDIKDGAVYLPVGQLQIGIHNAAGDGVIRIGDGNGQAGSAILDLRSGTSTQAAQTTQLNLGTHQSDTDAADPSKIGASGTIIIESDGILEGSANTATFDSNTGIWSYQDAVTRVGRHATDQESAIIVKAGGVWNARGTVEIASRVDVNANGTTYSSKGLIHLDGIDATMNQTYGSLFIGYNGEAQMIVENGATYRKLSHAVDPTSGLTPSRGNLYIARDAPSTSQLIIRNNGQFIRDSGGAVGDMYIGFWGNGTVNVENGGKFTNLSTNWDWVGVEQGSKGYIYINEGGEYHTTSASLVIGRDSALDTLPNASGLVQVDQGTMYIGGDMQVSQNGDGTFRLLDGTASVGTTTIGNGSGTGNGLIDVQGGELTIRGNFFAGRDNNSNTSDNSHTGSATYTQSAGTVTSTNAISLGLSSGYTATFTQTGGTFTHLNSDTTIGENGTATMYIGTNATFVDQATADDAFFFVGRNNGSNGTLIVDGYLEKTGPAAGIRVGHGSDGDGMANNTTGRGLIGGSGTIKAPGSITIGNNGTITAGTTTTSSSLNIDGGLNLISTSGSASNSTLFVNFDNTNYDQITIFGSFNIDNAVIDGTWNGGATGIDSRYWVIINNDSSQIPANYFANMNFTSNHTLANDYFALGAEGFVTIDGMEFAMFYAADYETGDLFSGNDLMLSAMGTVVPEPSLSILSMIGLSLLALRRRR